MGVGVVAVESLRLPRARVTGVCGVYSSFCGCCDLTLVLRIALTCRAISLSPLSVFLLMPFLILYRGRFQSSRPSSACCTTCSCGFPLPVVMFVKVLLALFLCSSYHLVACRGSSLPTQGELNIYLSFLLLVTVKCVVCLGVHACMDWEKGGHRLLLSKWLASWRNRMYRIVYPFSTVLKYYLHNVLTLCRYLGRLLSLLLYPIDLMSPPLLPPFYFLPIPFKIW